jgi:PKD repeat protein
MQGSDMRIVMILVAFMFFFTGVPVIYAQSPPTGVDWVITQDTLVQNEDIYLNCSNLTVKSGFTLDLRNVNITQYYDSVQTGVTVESGATLKMSNCTYNASEDSFPFFVSYGTLELTASNISNVGVFDDNSGIQIRTGKATVLSCDLSSFEKNNIYCCNSDLLVRDSIIQNDRDISIYANTSNIQVDNCTFNGEGNGLTANSCKVTITGSKFHTPGWYNDCIYVYNSSTTISNSDFGRTFGRYAHREESFKSSAKDYVVAIRDCYFIDCTNSVQLNDSFYGFSGIEADHPELLDVSASVFFGLPYGIVTNYHVNAIVENNVINNTNDNDYSFGIVANSPGRERFFLRNNTMNVGVGVTIQYGAACIEDNLIIDNGCPYGNQYVYSNGPSIIRRNTIIGGYSYYEKSGIKVYVGDTISIPEISHNIISKCDIGIEARRQTSTDVIIADIIENKISDTPMGLVLTGPARISNNYISGAFVAIYMSLSYSSNCEAVITRNEIHGSTTGIRTNAKSIVDNNTIEVKDIGVEYNCYNNWSLPCNILNNSIRANNTGIQIYTSNKQFSGFGSIAGNTIAQSEKMIQITGTDYRIDNNTFFNLSSFGIYALDCFGEIGQNEYFINPGSMFNACRVVRFWTCPIEVLYNGNPPALPPSWKTQYNYAMKICDVKGETVFNGSCYGITNRQLIDYVVKADGTNISRNPYTFLAWASNVGAGSTILNISSMENRKVYLYKHPDLVAKIISLSSNEPCEGELISITGTIMNNGYYNVDHEVANLFNLELELDGEFLFGYENISCPEGELQDITASWVASQGWHTATLLVDTSETVAEVFEDNNIISRRFYVVPLLRGNFTADKLSVETYQPVEFTVQLANSSEDAAGYRFEFGDGMETEWLTNPNVSHVYVDWGQYVAKAFIQSRHGPVWECQPQLMINVSPQLPDITISTSSDNITSGKSVLFRALLAGGNRAVTSCVWYFGDAGYYYSRTEMVAEHIFEKPGNHTVTVSVVFDGRFYRNATITINVRNRQPTAAGECTPAKGTVATIFNFVLKGTDQDGFIIACKWDFGDGSGAISPMPTHSYTSHGIFYVNLTVLDDSGDWSIPVTFVIQVEDAQPIPMMKTSSMTPTKGEEVRFNASGTTDPDDPVSALAFNWDFGDGTSERGMIVKHTYKQPGTYKVILRVDDGAGGSATKEFTVKVSESSTPVIDSNVAALVTLTAFLSVLATLGVVRLRTRRAVAATRPVKRVKRT